MATLTGAALAQQAPAPEAQAEEAAPARPQMGTAVAAVVNDDPISTFDVQQRVRLLMATSGAQLTDEALSQMQGQALRDLIEERLKLQEAARFELVIPDEQIEEELARLAASGGGTVQELERDLAQQGIALDTLRDKLRADTAWEELVRGRYNSRVVVPESEVEQQLDDMREARQDTGYLLSEICLPLDDPSNADQMRNVGMQMIDQMRQGVPFQALAQQFSACPSAARGGDMGWMRPAEMSPALRPVVEQLAEGNVSMPVPADGMMVMLAVRQKREAAEAGEQSYEVAYAGAPKSIGREAAEAAFARLKATGACEGSDLGGDLGEGVGVAVLPMLPASAFEASVEASLATLGRGDLTEVIETDTAYHAALLCQKDEGLGLPSRDQVESQLRSEAFERLSRRYLRDVERDSAVEMRMASGGA